MQSEEVGLPGAHLIEVAPLEHGGEHGQQLEQRGLALLLLRLLAHPAPRSNMRCVSLADAGASRTLSGVTPILETISLATCALPCLQYLCYLPHEVRQTIGHGCAAAAHLTPCIENTGLTRLLREAPAAAPATAAAAPIACAP